MRWQTTCGTVGKEYAMAYYEERWKLEMGRPMARAVRVLDTMINVDPVNYDVCSTRESRRDLRAIHHPIIPYTVYAHFMVKVFGWHCSTLKQEGCPS